MVVNIFSSPKIKFLDISRGSASSDSSIRARAMIRTLRSSSLMSGRVPWQVMTDHSHVQRAACSVLPTRPARACAAALPQES